MSKKAEALEGVRVRSLPNCYLCGKQGAALYSGLRDRIFDAPGTWSVRSCPRCGLVWLDPQPLAEDMRKVYPSDYFTHAEDTPSIMSWARQTLQHSAARGKAGVRMPYWREHLLGCEALLADLPPGKVLDVGCGSGKSLALLRDLGWEVCGVEPDASAARAARSAHGLEVFEGTLEQARFKEGRFDAVTLNHVIEHVEDPVSVLAECRRVLRPGGRLALMTPNIGGLGHRVFGRAWMQLDPPRHWILFDPKTMRTVVERSGLGVESLETSARLAMVSFVASWLIRRLGWYDMKTPRIETLLATAAGLAFHAVERGLCSFSDQGDDLVLLATRR